MSERASTICAILLVLLLVFGIALVLFGCIATRPDPTIGTFLGCHSFHAREFDHAAGEFTDSFNDGWLCGDGRWDLDGDGMVDLRDWATNARRG